MARITKKDLEKKKNKMITLKGWYQTQMNRLSEANELRNLAKYGRLLAFYNKSKMQFGGEYILKPREEWNKLYQEYLD